MTVSTYLAEYLPDDLHLVDHTVEQWETMAGTDVPQGWTDVQGDGFPICSTTLNHTARMLPDTEPGPDTVLSVSGYAYALAMLAATERDLESCNEIRATAYDLLDKSNALPLTAVLVTMSAAALDDHHGRPNGDHGWADEMEAHLYGT